MRVCERAGGYSKHDAVTSVTTFKKEERNSQLDLRHIHVSPSALECGRRPSFLFYSGIVKTPSVNVAKQPVAVGII